MGSFRDLLVWQKAIELAIVVHKLSAEFPREEAFGLSSQMRRAAVMIPSQIAAGQGRLERAEFRHLLSVARSANYELQTQFEIARELNLGTDEALGHLEHLSQEVGRMLYGMMESLKSPA